MKSSQVREDIRYCENYKKIGVVYEETSFK